jgi:hypothetical protein
MYWAYPCELHATYATRLVLSAQHTQALHVRSTTYHAVFSTQLHLPSPLPSPLNTFLYHFYYSSYSFLLCQSFLSLADVFSRMEVGILVVSDRVFAGIRRR